MYRYELGLCRTVNISEVKRNLERTGVEEY